MLAELESQTEALVGRNRKKKKSFPDEKVVINNSYIETRVEVIKTRVEVINRENYDLEDVDYPELSFKLSVSENIAEKMIFLVNKITPNVIVGNFSIALGDKKSVVSVLRIDVIKTKNGIKKWQNLRKLS